MTSASRPQPAAGGPRPRAVRPAVRTPGRVVRRHRGGAGVLPAGHLRGGPVPARGPAPARGRGGDRGLLAAPDRRRRSRRRRERRAARRRLHRPAVRRPAARPERRRRHPGQHERGVDRGRLPAARRRTTPPGRAGRARAGPGRRRADRPAGSGHPAGGRRPRPAPGPRPRGGLLYGRRQRRLTAARQPAADGGDRRPGLAVGLSPFVPRDRPAPGRVAGRGRLDAQGRGRAGVSRGVRDRRRLPPLLPAPGRIGAVEIDLISYGAPVVAALVGRLLPSERLGAATVAGLLSILAGFLLLERRAIAARLAPA